MNFSKFSKLWKIDRADSAEFYLEIAKEFEDFTDAEMYVIPNMQNAKIIELFFNNRNESRES